MFLRTSLISSLLFCLFLPWTVTAQTQSAVILQYHHVDSATPRSTSVTPEELKAHIDWLINNDYKILPLPIIVDAVKNDQPLPAKKIAAITFDDSPVSVCQNAAPMLIERKVPFTVFINTHPIEANYASQCTWAQLKSMMTSGLMTAANHSHSHHYMVSRAQLAKHNWHELMKDEVLIAERLIETHLGSMHKLFAYPYGEFNQALESIVRQLGYVGFGQQSGAINRWSDLGALPRFAASGTYADLNTLATKLQSLPFPATVSTSTDNPIAHDSATNPPKLIITPTETLPHGINCYNAQGEPINVEAINGKFIASATQPLSSGRQRYNCTSDSGISGRFYWYSHQWIID